MNYETCKNSSASENIDPIPHFHFRRQNNNDIGHKPYRPRPYLDIWNDIGHKKCSYRPQTTSATSISATVRNKRRLMHTVSAENLYKLLQLIFEELLI